MPLSDDMVRIVGFVVKDDEPVGTCFLARVRSELRPDDRTWDHAYLITAGHCVPPDGYPRGVWMTTSTGEFAPFPAQAWKHHAEGVDIAAAAFVTGDDERDWMALKLYDQCIDNAGILSLRLGLPVIYVGLLKPIRSMHRRGQPMVRTATIGAFEVNDVPYGRGQYRADSAHLIDCKSNFGFSGSPAFVDVGYPGPRFHTLPHDFYKEPLARIEPSVGEMHHYNALWGMLVGYGDEQGVGVVLPINRIHEAVNHEELAEMRKERDEARVKREQTEDNGFEAISAESDRVSLDGVEFEDALKALLNTPPSTNPE